MDALKRWETPAQVIKAKDIEIFQYKPGLAPPPRHIERFGQLGSQFSLGRSRWVVDDVSIFSVADGKRLASTPPSGATYYENLRMNKIQRAALETPTVAGYRLLPEFTPGRAMMWGTILAMWGTGALVATAMKTLDIHGVADASSKIKPLFEPMVEYLRSQLAPLKQVLALKVAGASTVTEGLPAQVSAPLEPNHRGEMSEFIERLRRKLS